jgi:zinc finger protein
VTKLLLTRIPFYKEVILSSFACPHCNFSNSALQSAGEILPRGIELILRVEQMEDLDRQVIKTDHCSVQVPELELEIPAGTQEGEITNVEGILRRVKEGLEQEQPRRKEEHPEDFESIEKFLGKIKACLSLEMQFTLVGNNGRSTVSVWLED